MKLSKQAVINFAAWMLLISSYIGVAVMLVLFVPSCNRVFADPPQAPPVRQMFMRQAPPVRQEGCHCTNPNDCRCGPTCQCPPCRAVQPVSHVTPQAPASDPRTTMKADDGGPDWHKNSQGHWERDVTDFLAGQNARIAPQTTPQSFVYYPPMQATPYYGPAYGYGGFQGFEGFTGNCRGGS